MTLTQKRLVRILILLYCFYTIITLQRTVILADSPNGEYRVRFVQQLGFFAAEYTGTVTNLRRFAQSATVAQGEEQFMGDEYAPRCVLWEPSGTRFIYIHTDEMRALYFDGFQVDESGDWSETNSFSPESNKWMLPVLQNALEHGDTYNKKYILHVMNDLRHDLQIK